MEKKIFKFPQCVFIISIYLPLEKKLSPLFVPTWIPTTHESLVPSLIEMGPVVLEKIF